MNFQAALSPALRREIRGRSGYSAGALSSLRLRHLVFGLALFVASGCKPAPGSSCSKGEARCLDKTTQLACQDGKYIATPCRGPNGCGIAPEGIRCDISGNKPGDPCSTEDDGAAACTDDKTLIVCQGGQYQPAPCRGPAGCKTNDGRPLCDTTIAAAGDGCKDADKPKACSTDGKQYLVCKAGKMTVELECRGPDGCKSEGGKLDCDLTIAQVGDTCLKEMDGKNACSLDRKSIVVCKGGKFEVDEPCKPPEGCLATDGSIRCEKPK